MGTHAMASKLDQLKSMTVVVADTGDMQAIEAFKPVDCTTNPTLILKAAEMEAYKGFVDEAVQWAGKQGGNRDARISAACDRLAVTFGAELTKRVPGRVSTEVDADLSFDTAKSVSQGPRDYCRLCQPRHWPRAHSHQARLDLGRHPRGGNPPEGGRRLQSHAALQHRASSGLCGSRAFLISPFVGRILDWYKKSTGQDYTSETDPGVLSVRSIYAYYKAHGHNTVVMGASFRNIGEIEALAGCDRLTIAPALLDQLAKDEGTLVRVLDPAKAAAAEKPARIPWMKPPSAGR